MVGPTFIPRPLWAKAGRNTAAQRAGRAYERKAGARLRELAADVGWTFHDHPWILDEAGALASPDFLLETPSRAMLLIEVKLTWVDTRQQLERYAALLAQMNFSPVPCSVVRNLTPDVPQDLLVEDLFSIKPYGVLHLWV